MGIEPWIIKAGVICGVLLAVVGLGLFFTWHNERELRRERAHQWLSCSCRHRVYSQQFPVSLEEGERYTFDATRIRSYVTRTDPHCRVHGVLVDGQPNREREVARKWNGRDDEKRPGVPALWHSTTRSRWPDGGIGPRH